MASLELENVGLVDKIAMLEHGVKNLKVYLNDSVLRNTDLQESVVGLESRVHKSDEDISWVLSCGIAKLVDKLIAESSFFKLTVIFKVFVLILAGELVVR